MFEEAVKRIRSINFNQMLDEVLDDQRYFILDLIRSQLIKGKGGDGDLNSYKSKSYVEFKRELGLLGGQSGSNPNYDLFFSGELYRSLIATIKAEYIEIEFASAKLPLVEASTEMTLNDSNVLTLNPVNLQILIDRIKPLIQNKINDNLGI
jgi:hypothetical protein